MKCPTLLLLALLGATASAQYPGSQPIQARYRKGVAAIKIEDAKQILTFLSTQCEGRGTGQPGFQKAADYVAARFKEFGLKPVGDNGTYFQNVPFLVTSVDPTQSFLAAEDGVTKLEGADSISFAGIAADMDTTAPAVLLRVNGSGVTLDSLDDLKGKIVFVDGSAMDRGMLRQVFSARPAVIATIVDKIAPAEPTVSRTAGSPRFGLTRISVSKEAATRFVGALTKDPAVLDTAKTPAGKAEVVDLHASLHLEAKVEKRDLAVPNVVGLLEGSDPKLKAEIVGVGAHLDHLGKHGDDVYPGADDDGSGSTAVLEIVKAFHDGGQKPRRSILFMTFCGEEMGLLGSGYYSDHPIYPHKDMIAELQMDMVGRDSEGEQNGDPKRVDVKSENIDTIRLVGSKRISTELDKLIQADNKYIDFRFKYDAEDVYTRSDHYNFAKHDIPIAFLFDGFHPDYHRTTDTVDKIDWAKLTNAAKLYYIVALDLADRPEPPVHDVHGD